jgi:hypothetical protein
MMPPRSCATTHTGSSPTMPASRNLDARMAV